MSVVPPRFSPLHQPRSGPRIAALLAGPLLWLVALAVVGVVVDQTDAVGFGLAIAAASLALWVPVMLLSRRRRVREQGEADAPHAG